MAYLPIPDPASLPPVPWRELPREWIRLVFYRYFPWFVVTRWRFLTQSIAIRLRGGRRERVAIAAIQDMMPDATTENLWRLTVQTKVLKHLGRRTFAPVFARSRADLIRMLNPVGLETLDALKEKAQGVIIITVHAGFYAWSGPALLGMGYPVHLIQQGYAAPGKLLMFRMADWGKMILPYPEPGQEGFYLKKLHDMLLQGEWLQHTGDFPDPKTGIRGELFGAQVQCVRAPWALARLSGAPAVPIIILADEKLQPQMLVGPAIHVSAESPASKALPEAFQTYLNFIEEALQGRRWNLHPEQWIAMTRT